MHTTLLQTFANQIIKRKLKISIENEIIKFHIHSDDKYSENNVLENLVFQSLLSKQDKI